MKKNLVVIAICLASFLGCLDLTIVNTALPAIQQNLHASFSSLQWVMTGLLATLSASMVLAGRLADVFGHRRLILIGLVLFGLSSLFAALASNIYILIAARIVQGLGIAVLYTVPPAIINHLFSNNKSGKAMGLYFSASSLGIASGPLLGGLILSVLSWHYIFFLNIPVVIVAYLICSLNLSKEESVKKGALDVKGSFLLAFSLIMLLVTTTTFHQLNLITLSTGLLCIISVFWFIRHEKACCEPMLDLTLFKSRMFTLSGLANMILALFYSAAFFLMPLYLHYAKGFSEYQIGLMLMPTTLSLALASPWVNRLVDRFGVILVLALGFVFFTISALMQQGFNQQTWLGSIILSYIFMGVGWAFILSPSFASALMAVPKSQSGVATGALGTLHNAGGSIGLATAVLLLQQRGQVVLAQQFIAHQSLPFIFIGVLAAVMGGILLVANSVNPAIALSKRNQVN